MRFLYPEFIYLMLIPAALLVYLISTNKDRLERVFDPKTLERLRISGDSLGRKGHNLLAFAAFFFMTLALAQPVIEEGEMRIKSKGADIVIALDLSRSMDAADFYPDRFSFAKQKIEEILPKLPAGRIGLVGFTSASFVIAPLTEDRETVSFLLKRLDQGGVTAEGTDILSALRGAEKLLRKSSAKKVLLVTDGGDAKDMEKVSEFVEKNGIELIVWMVATDRGAPIPMSASASEGKEKVVISRANRALREPAQRSGGLYVPATLSQADEREILAHLNEESASEREYERVVHKCIQLFYYPLFLALVMLPFALYSVGSRRNALSILFLSVPYFLSPTQAKAGIMDFALIKKAERAYAEGEYNTSTKAFEKLSASKPKNEVWFDLAGSYYKSGRYQMALQTYRKIVTSDRKLEMAKLYGMANSFVKLGDLEKGAALYRRVLEMGEDEDARANLELVLKLLREQKRKKKGGPGGEEENRKEKKGGSAEKASAKDGAKPGSAKSAEVSRKLSKAEERKWMQLIQKQPLKSKLYPLTPPEEEQNVNPW
ncbi:VWA domain-containing protein [Hydrogenimonas sp.]